MRIRDLSVNHMFRAYSPHINIFCPPPNLLIFLQNFYWASLVAQLVKNLPVMQELLLLPSSFSRVQLCATPETAAHQAPPPWDSPGKNTGVGWHFLLQCVKVKSLSHVWLLATSWTAAHQAPPSMGFSRQVYWSGLHCNAVDFSSIPGSERSAGAGIS